MNKPQHYDLTVSDGTGVTPARVILDGNTITAAYGGVTIGFDTDIVDTLDAAVGDFQAEHQLAERALYVALRRHKFVTGLRLARAVFTAQYERVSVTEADELLSSTGVESETYERAQRLVDTILIGAGWERWTDQNGRPGRASSDAVIVDLRTGAHLLGGNYGDPTFKWVDPITHKRDDAVGEWWRVGLDPRQRDRVGDWELKLPFDPWKMRTAHNVAILNAHA